MANKPQDQPNTTPQTTVTADRTSPESPYDVMAENILYYMKMHHKTRHEMCDALDVKYTTFTDWVKGNAYPRIEKIERMANYFNIQKSDLIESRRQRLSHHGFAIRIFDRISSEEITAFFDHIPDSEILSEHTSSAIRRQKTKAAASPGTDAASKGADSFSVLAEYAKGLPLSGKYFALRIHDDSMSPGICDGDVVIVRQQSDAESGDIVVVFSPNQKEAACKRLRKYCDGIELFSGSPTSAPMEVSKKELADNSVKIIGKVVELRRKL